LEVSYVVVLAYYTNLLFRVPLTFTDDKYDYMHYAYGFCNVVIYGCLSGIPVVISRSDFHIMYTKF